MMSAELLAWFLGGGCALLGAGIGAWFRFGPGARVGAVADAILGSPVIRDRHGGVIDNGQPGLVQRVGTLEDAIKLLVDQDFRLTVLENGHIDHENRIINTETGLSSLLLSAAERTAMHQESTAALNLIRDEQTDTRNGEAD